MTTIRDEDRPFWHRSATWLQVTTIVLPLILLLGGWMISMQATSNQHSYALTQQSQTLKDVQSDIRRLTETDSARGERLARIEAKIDILMNREAK